MEPKSILPNIVFIFADDLGYGDLGSYGSKKIPTPNIDRIAAQGIKFTDAHSSSAVCTPSRYSVMTGRYCWRSRLKRGVLGGYDFPLIEKERLTIARILKERGYHTAAIGKWHLGLEWPVEHYDPSLKTPGFRNEEPDIDYSKPIKGGPTNLGFDYFFGISGSLDMPPYCFIENEHTVGIPNIPKEPLYQQQIKGPMTPGWRDDKVDITFTEKAKKFIQNHVHENEDEPFFLYLCTAAPHRPCDIRPEFVIGKSEAGDRGDMIVLFDWVVGQINNEIEHLGLTENTLFIISSDNGARKSCFNGKDYGHKSNGHWRGQKGDIWEGGHREPLIARWPGKIEPNKSSHEPLCLIDLFATFSALIDYSIHDNAAEDSFNMLPAFLDQNQGYFIRDSMVHHSDLGHFSLRQGKWKFIRKLGSGGFTKPIRKLPKKGGPKGQLYNLEEDPEEKNNLWNNKPEIVKKMKKVLEMIKNK
ncbi:MAG: sulfatase family protein [Promethearchaeota archaeon]